MTRSRAPVVLLAALLALVVPRGGRAQPAAPPAATAPASPPPPPPAPDAREEARSHFDLGLYHFDRQEWAAALAEFLRAREIYPTRAATKNAAICLHKENRLDEALDLFEALERDYPDLSPADRELADRELAELRAQVGALAVEGAATGASVVVDGRSRGTVPLSGPLRLAVGSHTVRVFAQGFVPFEQRIDIASQQTVTVQARLVALTRSGRLRVAEEQGRVLDVVVDNAVVGKTPWVGAVAPGDHCVLLRGQGELGTPPASAPVTADGETPVTLLATPLAASLRIEPMPGAALVTLDGVPLGRGSWEGRLAPGVHRVEATASGYFPAVQSVALAAHEPRVLALALERDLASAVWGLAARPHVVLDLGLALAVLPSLGGQVAASCSGGCSASLPIGALGRIGATYELPRGLGFGLEAGYTRGLQTLVGRPAQVSGRGMRATDSGSADDLLTLGGVLLGASVSLHRGETWPLTLRLALGAVVATVKDDREGLFTTSPQGHPPSAPYSVGLSESHGVALVYAAPEVRVGRRFGDHVELDAGLAVLVLAAPSPPSWGDQRLVGAGPRGTQGDGEGGFGGQTLIGSLLLAIAPGVSARYAF